MDIELKLEATRRLVLAHRQRLKQILVNLVDNALKFTPANGSVTVRTVRPMTAGASSLRTPGFGIPADELPFLFERFFRGQDGKKRTSSAPGWASPSSRS